MSAAKRTSHSDLAAIVLAHCEALAKVPAGYCVNDNATLHSLRSAAEALIEQDNRIDQQTIALRMSRAVLRLWKIGDRPRALEAVNACLRKPERKGAAT